MYRCERTWPPPCPGDALPAAPGAGAKKEHRSQAAMGSSPASFLTPAPSSSACLQNLWAQKALAQGYGRTTLRNHCGIFVQIRKLQLLDSQTAWGNATSREQYQQNSSFGKKWQHTARANVRL
ncbi:uncharacterized protein GJ701_005691 isoform 1-T1 [Geothlypis trichas]